MSALEPGLYRATVRGVADTLVMVHDDGTAMTTTRVNERSFHHPDDITDARPLIVLDLEDPAETVRHMRAESAPWDCIEQIADQIEAQTKPARIPEPGLWGVVEAGIPSHTLRRKFVRLDSPTRSVWVWIDADGSSSARYVWDSLIDPTLIREGVDS